MKPYLLTLLLFFSGTSVFAQSVVDVVIKAIEQGNADKISENSDKIVDITINNDQSTYSRSQGKVVLNNFFSNNPVKSFSIKHKGRSSDNSSVYLIGSLQVEDSSRYRVYLYFKDRSGILYLQEIRFEQ